ncbi:S-adenosyl-L-methionine-dependent methyltransferase [Fennellomyces sp. T-0311]|nr:S-adenosyl-L-methionine-dependent methyltransferase [Fennellomyces sp. T-0311]
MVYENASEEQARTLFKQNDPSHIDEKAYLLGTDEQEIQRLNRQHEAMKIVCKGNFGAPVVEQLRKGINVLDSACGTGSWTIDMSKEYPHSNFVALDSSSMFAAQDINKPPNCKFVEHDVTEPLPFPDNYFDYVHQRFITAGVREHKWPQIIGNLMRVLKPGGWIELNEPSVSEIANAGPKYTKLSKAVDRSFKKRGTRLNACRELELHLINAGATNIDMVPFLFPLQHGEVGKIWCEQDFIELYRRILKPAILEECPEFKDPKVYEQFLEDATQECAEYKSYMIIFRYCAQKPY